MDKDKTVSILLAYHFKLSYKLYPYTDEEKVEYEENSVLVGR